MFHLRGKQWEIHRIRSEINEPETYTFEKTQYEIVMKEIRVKAQEEMRKFLSPVICIYFIQISMFVWMQIILKFCG